MHARVAALEAAATQQQQGGSMSVPFAQTASSFREPDGHCVPPRRPTEVWPHCPLTPLAAIEGSWLCRYVFLGKASPHKAADSLAGPRMSPHAVRWRSP